jgi:hypothetical protein
LDFVNSLAFFWNIVDSLLMPVPETTSAEAFERYVGGKCLRIGDGKAWREIKAWTIALPRVVDSLPLPSGFIYIFTLAFWLNFRTSHFYPHGSQKRQQVSDRNVADVLELTEGFLQLLAGKDDAGEPAESSENN